MIRNSDVRVNATRDDVLKQAFVEMSSGIARPKKVQWRLEDAAKGRPCRPLGAYPLVAEECLDAGASFYNVTQPLLVMLSHLKRRTCNKLGFNLKEALTAARKEQSEADISELGLALSVNCPEVSVLATADKEIREAIQAEEALAECIESKLYAEKR